MTILAPSTTNAVEAVHAVDSVEAAAATDAVRSAGTRPLLGLTPLESAVVEAVAYADVFDWPLTPVEIHRYLPLAASPDQVAAALAAPSLQRFVARDDGYTTLAGRRGLVPLRRRRAALAAALWPRAIRYGRLVAALPFVRMVAVTGSLALDAAGAAADVDLLVVTEDGRLWLTRALAMGVVRAAAFGGLQLCPNYLLAESELRLDERSLFTAHELAQMVPIAPSPVYDELLRRNAWFRDFLPNAGPRPALTSDGPRRGRAALRRLLEPTLRSGVGDRIERWEMERKIRRLRRESTSAETRYDAACCKGHADEHGRRSLTAFQARLRRLGEAT